MSQQELLDHYPLHYMCCIGDSNGLLECLAKGKHSPFSLDPLNYWSPAHWAASHNQYTCLLHLAPLRALDICAERSRTTPLHLACEQGNKECVNFLISNGAMLNSQDSSGDTPLHKAARKGHIECIQLLISCGAFADTRNFYGRTASELSSINGHFQCASAITETLRMQKIQNNHEQQNNNGSFRLPLMFGCLNTHNGYACKRSRDSIAMDTLEEASDKRMRVSDPVLQIAADLIGQKNTMWRDDLQSSVMEHAAMIEMADGYMDYYSDNFAKENEAHRC